MWYMYHMTKDDVSRDTDVEIVRRSCLIFVGSAECSSENGFHSRFRRSVYPVRSQVAPPLEPCRGLVK